LRSIGLGGHDFWNDVGDLKNPSKMNQTQSYMEMHPGSHISSGPSYNHAAPTAPLGHYPQYPQPPVIPPSSSHYGPPQAYSTYGYANGVTSPQSAIGSVSQQVQSQITSLPGKFGVCGQEEPRGANSADSDNDGGAWLPACVRGPNTDLACSEPTLSSTAAI